METTTHRQNFATAPKANPKAIVGGGSCKYRFTILTDGLVRYEWADDSVFEDRASTFAIRRDLPTPEYKLIDSNDVLEIITSRFRLIYNKKPFTPSGLSIEALARVTNYHNIWRYGEPIIDYGGTAETLDGVNGRMPLGPGIISGQGFAGIDDSKSMLFEADGWVGTRRPGDRVDGYLFAFGHDFRDALKSFYAVSGKQPLLPRWALGNWWSRYYPYTADEYLKLMDRFKQEKIPMAVSVIDMDWHHVDVDAKHGNGWTGYTWNQKLFPNPPRFLKELHARNLKVTLNIHPADGVRSHEESYENMAKSLDHDIQTGVSIPFDVTNRKFFDAYFDILHRKLEKDGVDFWWVDWQQGAYSRVDGIVPLWMLNHYHFLDNAHNGKRPLTFSRYAGPGSHRYPVGFSGDTVITWESLDFQPEFTATASNIGFGWWSHDIGGHMGGSKSDERTARWLQLGVFSPILRLHSSNNRFNMKEPWTFGAEACKVMTDALQYRHRLIPYLYTMNVLAALHGDELVQPMYYAYPKHSEAYKFRNQFLFGTQLLVAPITTPANLKTGLAQVKAWMPPGRYIDIFTTAVYDGDREIYFHRPLSYYPVFAREGGIIPLDNSSDLENGGPNPESLELMIVVGADGSFDLLEDDGTGTGISDTKIISTPIRFNQKRGTLTIGPASAAPTSSESRQWQITFLGLGKHDLGKTSPYLTMTGAVSAPEPYQEDDRLKVWATVKHGSQLKIVLDPNPELEPTDIRKHLFPIIDNAQIDFQTKKDLWGHLSAEISKELLIGRVLAMDMEESLRGVVMEYLLADSRSGEKVEERNDVDLVIK
jgi:alpha-glucosidase (family GH31 glycosyl hydrolase)